MISRLRSLLPVTVATVFVLLTAGPSLHAQSEWNLMYDPTVQRGSLFGRPAPGPRIISVPRQRPSAPARRVLAPSVPRYVPVAVSVDAPAPERPKVNVDTFVVVLGDTLGELLANGIDDALKDVPNAAVIRKTRADSGLVRSDFYDWPKAARELLASDQRVSVAVILIGANDRQSIREGDVVHEPLSERWREIYRDRVDAVAQAFSDRRVPLIWIGAPPMQNTRLSADMIALNEIYRQRAERTGAVYVDLWPGFVDGDNRYSTSGPDLSGQIARLRANDGVHFTRSGARKAAHFADVALRRMLPGVTAGPVLAAPGPLPMPLAGLDVIPLPLELQAGGIEAMIDQMARLGTGFSPVMLPDIKVKPIAGPVLALTGAAVSAGGLLLAPQSAAPGESAQSAELNRVFGEGRAPVAAPGRADDFRWPKAQ
ncbi:MAG: SGNH/GDSL hydrolase family protein [Bosea sp. (in: a-proteobacteria)]